jgi:Rv0078B-related antitoxin
MAAADVEKFRMVFDMCEAGVQMYRQRMRREAPAASDEEIESTAALPEVGRDGIR